MPACSYRPALNFSAVFWFPNRSYTTPKRGAILFHVGMSMGPKLRACATNLPCPDVSVGMPDAKYSQRAP